MAPRARRITAAKIVKPRKPRKPTATRVAKKAYKAPQIKRAGGRPLNQ